MELSNFDFSALLTTMSLTGIGVGTLAWLTKHLMTTLLNKDVERFKAELRASTEVEIERFKAGTQLEVQRQLHAFTAVYAKRTAALEEMRPHIERLGYGVMEISLRFDVWQKSEDAEHCVAPTAEEQAAMMRLSEITSSITALLRFNRGWFTEHTEAVVEGASKACGDLLTEYQLATPSDQAEFTAALAGATQAVEDLRAEARRLLSGAN
jgi:hypothetical protein